MKKILVGIIGAIGISILAIVIWNFNNTVDFSKPIAESSISKTAASSDLSKEADSLSSSGQASTQTSASTDAKAVGDLPSDSTTASNNSSSHSSVSSSAKSTAEASKQEEEKKNESIVDKLIPDSVENKVDAIAGGEVSASDLLEVIKIVGGKLGTSEIAFLFSSAKSEYWETTSIEDIEKARKILFTKLSDEDLEALTSFGKKYGRSMDIIKKDLDVAATKEGQMKAKGLID